MIIDLVERILPSPTTTIVVEVADTLYLVDTFKSPRLSDTVFSADGRIRLHDPTLPAVGVAYCVIQFLI